MSGLMLIAAALGVGGAYLLRCVGWRRAVFGAFRVRVGAMTWERRKLRVRDAESRTRVNAILETFVQAFNVMITARRDRDWASYCETRAPLLRAFAEEGVAMGYRLRRLGRFDATAFEQELPAARSGFRYLHYVGLGFWSGMRGRAPEQVETVASRLDPLLRYLCFDGYGFQRAFFEAPGNARALEPLRRLPGYAAHAAFQGVGRALWFRYMDDAPALISALDALGEFAEDGAAGVGLAATFVNPDRLAIPMELGRRLPPRWRAHFHLGMSFACKARDLNDAEWFSAELGRTSVEQRATIRAAIAACDRIEAEVRRAMPEEPYRVWRERMTQWLSDNVEYPLASRIDRTPQGDAGALENLANRV